MGQLLQPGETQKSAASFNAMDRPEDAGEKILGGGFAFQLHQFLVESIQVLVALDEKILNDFVHRPIRHSNFAVARCTSRT